MEDLEMLKGILNSYSYPIVFVDNEYIIRFMNKNAQYHYYEICKYKLVTLDKQVNIKYNIYTKDYKLYITVFQ